MFDWKSFFKGLAVFVGAAAATATIQVVQNRVTSKTAPPITGGNIAAAAGTSAALALMAYLAQSPVVPPPTTAA